MWTRVSGDGVVASWMVMRPPTLPAYAGMVPFVLLLVELQEGVRLIGYLVDDAGRVLTTDGTAENVRIGARVAPGINVGFSIDQSRSAIDIPLALQSATLDLTQLGFTASVDRGPWTWASAVVHGFGNIRSRRDTGLGIATAGYNARLDGVLSEVSYYWTRDQYRVVPKGAFEYVRAQTGALQEMLSSLADFYDEEVETSVSRFVTLIEPMLLVSMGLVIAVLVLALYMPLFQLSSVVNQ